MSKYYITTPIYYVNAAPHIGTAYTTMVADTIKRFKTMQGYDAVLTTGSDEHGVNVERSAERAGKSPKEFTDAVAAEFQRQWQMLGLQIDHFQRTTSPQHAQVVQSLFEKAGGPARADLQGTWGLKIPESIGLLGSPVPGLHPGHQLMDLHRTGRWLDHG